MGVKGKFLTGKDFEQSIRLFIMLGRRHAQTCTSTLNNTLWLIIFLGSQGLGRRYRKKI